MLKLFGFVIIPEEKYTRLWQSDAALIISNNKNAADASRLSRAEEKIANLTRENERLSIIERKYLKMTPARAAKGRFVKREG